MAIAEKHKKVLTVGALKKFLDDLPDRMPIRGDFEDHMEAIVWKTETDESGPRRWMSLETI